MELSLQNPSKFHSTKFSNHVYISTCIQYISPLSSLSLFLLLLVRTMLLALIRFMPTDGKGTIGSLDCTPEARRQMAIR